MMKKKVIFSVIFRIIIFSGTLNLLMCESAFAMQWMVMPTFSTVLFHDDNYYLQENQPSDTWGSVISMGVGVTRNMELNKMYFNSALNIRNFSNAQVIDGVDEYYSAGYNQSFETQQLALDVAYNKELTTIYELGTNGSIRAGRDSVKVNFQPRWIYSLTDTDSMVLSYLYTETDYKALPTELADYHYYSWDVSYKKSTSAQNIFSVRYSRTLLDVPDIGIIGLSGVNSETITNSLFVEYTRNFSETLNAEFQVGVRRTEQITTLSPLPGNPTTTTEGDSPLFLFDVSKSYESFRVNLAASRQLAPSGNASLNENEKFDLGLYWDITSKNTANLNVSILKIKSGVSTGDNNSTNYLLVEPRFSRRLNLNWNISVNYRFRKQTIKQSGSKAYSRGLFLNVKYIYGH